MADETFPKEPSPAALDDDDSLRRRKATQNSSALTAFGLGAFSVIVWLSQRKWGDDGSFFVFVLGCLLLVLGPEALIFGIMGLHYRYRNPTTGGLGYAVSGIVMGTSTWLHYGIGLCAWK